VVAIARNAERAAVAEESDSVLADVPEGETTDVSTPADTETGDTETDATEAPATVADDLADQPGEEGTAE